MLTYLHVMNSVIRHVCIQVYKSFLSYFEYFHWVRFNLQKIFLPLFSINVFIPSLSCEKKENILLIAQFPCVDISSGIFAPSLRQLIF